MKDQTLINKVLSNPRVLWNILERKDIRILGPWREAKGKNWSIHNGWRRFSPCGAEVICAPSVTVYSCSKPEKPEDYEFYEWGGVDHDGLEKAIEEWRAECAIWKPWKYTFDNLEWELPHGYASTKEKAQKVADKILRDLGYLLYDGD